MSSKLLYRVQSINRNGDGWSDEALWHNILKIPPSCSPQELHVFGGELKKIGSVVCLSVSPLPL